VILNNHMDKLIIKGGLPLKGDVVLSGAKNVALKTCIASLLTDDKIVLNNIPKIRDVMILMELIECLGIRSKFTDHRVVLERIKDIDPCIPLDVGARLRTSSLVLGPMLARYGKALIPNPGGCRIGARPIDRHIEALKKMGADIRYFPSDGYFHAEAAKLHGATIEFPKNTHTGTEAVILAAVTAEGTTIIKNAALEVEVDDLISFLKSMGADIIRNNNREIIIEGVKKLHGTEYSIMSDRNEEVTFAIAAAMTNGLITVRQSVLNQIPAFTEKFISCGGMVKVIDKNTTQYGINGKIKPSHIVTTPHPGFMTDWQAPWAIFMTQAQGVSTIHETVFESRFSYVPELHKMGAKIDFYDPPVSNPEKFYNFNWNDRISGYHQGIKITGPARLHNAVMAMSDLRAGATLVLAALTAQGESVIHGADQIDRGYENNVGRLSSLGADIRRESEEKI
jgi:UDP-N-acetylglucosamine 1-carboxyvinyltransferase